MPRGTRDSASSADDTWDRNWTRMGQVSPSMKEAALESAFPYIFHPGARKLLCVRGQKYISGKRLDEFIEYATGKGATVFIPFEKRTHQGYLEYVKELSAAWGKRCSELVLVQKHGDQWLDGVYSIEAQKETRATITHNFLGCSKVVPIQAGNELVIDFNYSENKALLVCRDSGFNKQLSTLFAQELATFHAKIDKVMNGAGAHGRRLTSKKSQPKQEINNAPGKAAPVVKKGAAQG